ncbi:Peptidoglycan synthase FtsI precursor [Serratia fonticola]|uniref:Peptidoglycan synthase FtsI n=1 Tax=Serratia fonticola TaxID=47917 RepID=A0A4U9U0I7_SERFO|nr:Peptidoglycan synthase FtsI precursor [Serratia fonticola]
MVTPLQLARVYATIGSLGVYRPLSITKVDPPVAGERVFPEATVRTVVHMMESVALPGGGGVKAAIKGYRIAIKTVPPKRSGRMVNTSTDISLIPRGWRQQASLVLLWWWSSTTHRVGNTTVVAISAPVFGAIMGGALRIMNVQPDALPTGDKSELVINNKEGSGGRS